MICESLNFCVQEKGLEIFANVIMTIQIHMIVRAKNADLSDIVRESRSSAVLRS